MFILRSDSGQWRPVPGREGAYEVSDRGYVRSLDRVVLRSDGRSRPFPGRLLTPSQDKRGYLFVCLQRYHRSAVHRLVLEAFRGPCPPGMETRHLDGCPRNNTLDNLVWGTHSENECDKFRHGTRIPSQRARPPAGLRTPRRDPVDVAQCVELYALGLSSLEIARELKSSSSVVLRALQAAGVVRRSTGGAREVDHARCVDLYEQGLSSEQVAQQVECDPSTVLDALQRAGVSVRPPGPRVATGGECRNLYGLGLSSRAIAELVGCSPMTAWRRVRESGATSSLKAGGA